MTAQQCLIASMILYTSRRWKNMNDDFCPPLLKNAIIDGPDTRSRFVLKEKRAKYEALNKNEKQAFSFQIDNNLIKTVETKKCDKGLFVDDGKIYLVELKGVDFNTACKQLYVTFGQLSLILPKYTYLCRAVVKEVPSKNNYPYSYKKLMAVLKKEENVFKFGSEYLMEEI